MHGQHLVAGGALPAADAQDQDHLAVFGHLLQDEAVGGPNLEPLGAPAEVVVGGGIAAPDQVDPEGVVQSRRQLARHEGHLLFAGDPVDALQRVVDIVDDHRRLDQRVGGDDVHRLGALRGRQPRQRLPDQLERGRRVLAAAVADDPGIGLLAILLADLFEDVRDRL